MNQNTIAENQDKEIIDAVISTTETRFKGTKKDLISKISTFDVSIDIYQKRIDSLMNDKKKYTDLLESIGGDVSNIQSS